MLPLMMWGAMRYGYKLISLLWAVVLMISIHSYQKLHSHLSLAIPRS
ncbi:MASE1 domain-containing protein [Escherichia coli]|nr:MASE1 domain-containing protein [Escherichia coli]